MDRGSRNLQGAGPPLKSTTSLSHADVHTRDWRSAGPVRGQTIRHAAIRFHNNSELAPRAQSAGERSGTRKEGTPGGWQTIQAVSGFSRDTRERTAASETRSSGRIRGRNAPSGPWLALPRVLRRRKRALIPVVPAPRSAARSANTRRSLQHSQRALPIVERVPATVTPPIRASGILQIRKRLAIYCLASITQPSASVGIKGLIRFSLKEPPERGWFCFPPPSRPGPDHFVSSFLNSARGGRSRKST